MNGYGFDSASQFFGESSFDSNGFDTNGFSNTEDNGFGFDSTSNMYGESFGNYSSDDFGSSFGESAFDENGFFTDEMINESNGFTMRAEDYEKLQKKGKEITDSLFGDVMGMIDDHHKKHPEMKKRKPMTDEEYRRHSRDVLDELGGESSKSKKKTDSSGMSEEEIAKSKKKLFESEPMTDDEISKSKKKLGFEFFTGDYSYDSAFCEGDYDDFDEETRRMLEEEDAREEQQRKEEEARIAASDPNSEEFKKRFEKRMQEERDAWTATGEANINHVYGTNAEKLRNSIAELKKQQAERKKRRRTGND